MVAALGVAAPAAKRDLDGRVIDEPTLVALGEVVDRLADAMAEPARCDALTVETLERLSIPRDDRSGR